MESPAAVFSIKLLLLLLLILCFLRRVPSSVLPNEALPTKSGYLTVNAATGSAIFYSFYESQMRLSSLSQTPLVIWLQGGPGCSSMTGNFYELGPWRVKSQGNDITLEPNSGSWNRIFGLLFLDNPIGTGFSVAPNPEEIPRDQKTVAKQLFTAITGFIELDPSFKSRPIYITGESYAGKYVPAIGYHIQKQNMRLPASRRVNLAGVAIGNGLTDPITQVTTHAANAYFSGLINEKQKQEMEKIQEEAVRLVKVGYWSAATNIRNDALQLLQNFTGLATLYDYTRQTPYETSLVAKFLGKPEVKRALGVNESMDFQECSDTVGDALHEDVMKSVKHMVELLVKQSKVLLYQGHFDLKDGVVATEAWVRKLRWEGIDKFLMADRNVWKVNGELAGYVQKWGSLSQVLVLGAGHLVPTDQPLSSQAMIEEWILEKGLFSNPREENLSDLEYSL